MDPYRSRQFKQRQRRFATLSTHGLLQTVAYLIQVKEWMRLNRDHSFP
jgi:hypothetical protein